MSRRHPDNDVSLISLNTSSFLNINTSIVTELLLRSTNMMVGHYLTGNSVLRNSAVEPSKIN